MCEDVANYPTNMAKAMGSYSKSIGSQIVKSLLDLVSYTLSWLPGYLLHTDFSTPCLRFCKDLLLLASLDAPSRPESVLNILQLILVHDHVLE